MNTDELIEDALNEVTKLRQRIEAKANISLRLIHLRWKINSGFIAKNEAVMESRALWWEHCEKSVDKHIPTFREFWQDEYSYQKII